MSDTQRLLAVLSDGEWHDHRSLYAMRMILHSRVAELRRRGHVIEVDRVAGDASTGPTWWYRLVPPADPAGDGTEGYNRRRGLRDTRVAKGLSLRDLETLSGVNRAVLSEIERRIRVPSPTQLAAISAALDVELVVTGRPTLRVAA